MLVNLFIGVNNILEFDIVWGSTTLRCAQHLNCLVALVYLAYTVDCAHDQLIKMSSKE